jgi:hypothetical protein
MNTFWVVCTPVYKLLVFSVPRNVENSYWIWWVQKNTHGDVNNCCSPSSNIHATTRSMWELWSLRSGVAEDPVLLDCDAASVGNRYRRLQATYCPHFQAPLKIRTCRHETSVSITVLCSDISEKNRTTEHNIITTNMIYGSECWSHWLRLWYSGGSLQSQWRI